MMKVEDFVNPTPEVQPSRGDLGIESPWLDFCELTLSGMEVHVVDASYTAHDGEGCLIKLTPGVYRVQLKLQMFGGDSRNAALRVIQPEVEFVVGQVIGKIGIDTARVAVYDRRAVEAIWLDEGQASLKVLNAGMGGGQTRGLVTLDEALGIKLIFVRSGFGDGCFEVRELRADNHRVGFDVTFIPPGKPYPFSGVLGSLQLPPLGRNWK